MNGAEAANRIRLRCQGLEADREIADGRGVSHEREMDVDQDGALVCEGLERSASGVGDVGRGVGPLGGVDSNPQATDAAREGSHERTGGAGRSELRL